MKTRDILLLSALLVGGLTACEEDPEGTTPGGDSKPNVTIYTYSYVDANRPDAADNMFSVRLASNSSTSEAYYLMLKAEDYDSKKDNENALADYVVSNGTRVDGLGAASVVDVTVSVSGAEYLCVAAKNGGSQHVTATEIVGNEWVDLVTGTYEFGVSGRRKGSLPAVKTTLQYCKSDKTLFRLKDVFGEGSSLKFTTMTGDEAKTADGTFVRVADQATISTLRADSVTNVPMRFRVRDIATWQNEVEFATMDGYACIMYDDYNCEFSLQYRDAYGSLGFDYDIFSIDEQ